MEVNFHIPDFTNHLNLNMRLVGALEKNPEYFREGVRIASVYGSYGGCVWNGGRYLGGVMPEEMIKGIKETVNGKGIPLRFTFTNPLLEKQHLGDPYCNRILRLCGGGFNEVIVMSPLLEDYLRENYPAYPLTSSTCKQIETIDGVLEELKKDYKYVVLDYNFNNRFEELEKIPPGERSRCEILINACCTPHCPRRGEHYRRIGSDQIAEWEHNRSKLSKTPFKAEDFQCGFMSNGPYDTLDYPTRVTAEALFEKYVPMGFSSFKIEGRTIPDVTLLEYYVYYMAKPEYRDRVRLDILRALTSKRKFFV